MGTLVRLKTGEVVNAEGDVTPEKLRRMGARIVAPQRTDTVDATAPDRNTVSRRVAAREKMRGSGAFSDFADSARGALDFGATKALTAGLMGLGTGVVEGFRKGSVSEGYNAGVREYNTEREVQRTLDTNRNVRSPIVSTVGEIAGAVANPVGAETGAGRVLAKIAPRAATGFKASTAGRAITRAGNSMMGRAARAGGNQAALQATFNGGNPGDAYVLGAGGGALMGGAIKGAGGVRKAWQNHSAAAAERVAARRAGEIIGRATDDAGVRYTPEKLAAEIEAGKAQGNSPIVADVSPEAMHTIAALARKPGLENANAAIRFGEQRLENAGNRFTQRLNRDLAPSADPISATQGRAALSAERKASAVTDYGDGVMKAELQDTPDMLDFVQNAPEVTKQALKLAAKNLGRNAQTAKLSLEFDDAGQPVFTKIPNMAVLDEVKKAYDGMIGASLKAGDGAHVGIRKELEILRKIAGEQNPAYLKSLYNQRGYFEKIAALEEGSNFLSRLQREPEQLLLDLKASKNPIEGVKYGVADAILALRHTQTEPLKRLRGMMRSKEQREVMKWLFGDEKKFNDFYKFMRTELNSGLTDSVLARGRQSITSTINQHADNLSEAGEVGADLSRRGATGFAFGGAVGLGSAGLRWHKAVTSAMSKSAQDKLADILLGDAKGLARQVRRAKAYDKWQARRTGKVVEKAGKYTGNYIGQQGD